MIKKILLFLVLNFVALAIGGLSTGTGVSSIWYQELAKAPWTPPGWMFGVAWTLIMICYAIYMAYLKKEENTKRVLILYAIQWVLNVSWNPIFFHFQNVLFGLIVISVLTVLVAYFFFAFRKTLQFNTAYIAPYLIWLIVATSLNAYILFNN